jgi:hypothetical protein
VDGVADDIGGAFLALGSFGHGGSMAQMASLENELEKLLERLCVEWGFCLHGDEYEKIVSAPQLEEREFARMVLQAEGFTPPEFSQWYKPIMRRFRGHFGRPSVKVEDFRL